MVKHTSNDTYIAFELIFKLMVIPLTKQLTCLSGSLWSRCLTGGRAERIEYLLLHEFKSSKFILPDKVTSSGFSGKRKAAAYKGGLVLDPKSGYYDKFILLLDFNSLYPSIIQEYNICHSTVARKKDEKGNWEESQPPPADTPTGILPRVLKNLVEKRRVVKNLIKNEHDKVVLQQLNIKQLALKLTANSMYGCLGFSASRFYAQPLAELITRKGRETLQKTVQLAQESMRLDVSEKND